MFGTIKSYLLHWHGIRWSHDIDSEKDGLMDSNHICYIFILLFNFFTRSRFINKSQLIFKYIWTNHLFKNNKRCVLVRTKTSDDNDDDDCICVVTFSSIHHIDS